LSLNVCEILHLIDPVPQGLRSIPLIQLCKQQPLATRIVVLASAPTPALRAAVQSLGIDMYLEKPVTLATIMEQIRSVLTRREAGA
jgi:DNA-binding NarL/FixJ family response regulator